MPSASMRYILPLVPFGLLVIGEELTHLSARHRTIFLVTAVCSGALFSLCLSIGDYQQCEADRCLPAALEKKGYSPSQTWYYGRMSYDWYLAAAGFNNLRADSARPHDNAYLVDESIPGDYNAAAMVCGGFTLVPLDTIRFFDWPFRTMGYRAGFYGNDRLPYTIRTGVPQKEYLVYLLKKK